MKMRLLMLLMMLLLALLMAATGFCVAETTEPLPEGWYRSHGTFPPTI
jgi:hypothetical protein